MLQSEKWSIIELNEKETNGDVDQFKKRAAAREMMQVT
jgi:hypothetical protein